MFPTPTIDENVIRYRVFFHTPHTGERIKHTIEDADQRFVRERCGVYMEFIENQTREFIWHKHKLHFTTVQLDDIKQHSSIRRYCLEGKTFVGDAIMDEWVVTWLLQRISLEFPCDNAIVQVNDTDGEFILIECADVLPMWVTPENSKNRVYIKDGSVHLVPLTIVPEVETSTLKVVHQKKQRQHTANHNDQRVLSASLNAVCAYIETRSSAAIQNIFKSKLEEASQYMRANRHRVRCILPSPVAHVLHTCTSSHQRFSLTGAAVEAFYYREPKSASTICSRMKVFPPTSMCQLMVTLSRCQYAQLKQQEFTSPKIFNRQNSSIAKVDENAVDIGTKIACGLELLYHGDEVNQEGERWTTILDKLLAQETTDQADAASTLSPDDDDAWLYIQPDTLEARLQKAALQSTVDDINAPYGNAEVDELQEMATMFKKFVSGVSEVEGVGDKEPPVELDMNAFMRILHGSGNTENRTSEDWDYDDDSDNCSNEGSQTDEEPDDPEELLMREAMAEMDNEIQDSTLSKTFTHVPKSVTKENHENDEEKPLNLDYNMLSNLLESLAAQEGLGGPASTILGEMMAK